MGNLQNDFLEFSSEVFIDHCVAFICLDLSQCWLLGPLDNELIRVGAHHDFLCHSQASLDSRVVMKAEDFWRVLQREALPDVLLHGS